MRDRVATRLHNRLLYFELQFLLAVLAMRVPMVILVRRNDELLRLGHTMLLHPQRRLHRVFNSIFLISHSLLELAAIRHWRPVQLAHELIGERCHHLLQDRHLGDVGPDSSLAISIVTFSDLVPLQRTVILLVAASHRKHSYLVQSFYFFFASSLATMWAFIS